MPTTKFSKFNNLLWECWFLGKNISDFVPPVWKLHNRIAIIFSMQVCYLFFFNIVTYDWFKITQKFDWLSNLYIWKLWINPINFPVHFRLDFDKWCEFLSRLKYHISTFQLHHFVIISKVRRDIKGIRFHVLRSR